MRGRVLAAAFAVAFLGAAPYLVAPGPGLAGSLLAATTDSTLEVVDPTPAPNPPGSGVVVVRGPYLQVGTPTSVVVRWRTDVSTAGRVLYGTAPDQLNSSVSDPLLVTNHELQLTGLSPGTIYYYAVGTATEVLAGGDADHRFRTAPPVGTTQPTRIWVLGDSGSANVDAEAVRDAYYGWSAGTTTHLWLMLGDNAYQFGTDTDYEAAVFDMYPEMLRRAVLWPTLGNHELFDSSTGNIPYFSIFTLPTQAQAGGVVSGTENYYSFDYGNIHFVVLDSMYSNRSVTGPMLTWLEADLQSTSQGWIIAYWHHPPYTKGSHDSDDPLDSNGRSIDMRQNALPILEDYGVDLILAGHSHSYERSYLLDGHYGFSSQIGNPASSPYVFDDGDGSETGDGAYTKPTRGSVPYGQFGDGAVYTVAGSSGLTSGGSLNHPAMVISLDVLGSVVLDVQGMRLDAKFLDATGTVRDDYTIIKYCLFDADKDGACDETDNCALIVNPAQEDPDADGIGSACDICPSDPLNDPDDDDLCAGPGFSPPMAGADDNCPLHANPQQEDLDGDGAGNVCDPDDDGDGVADGSDSQPLNKFICQDADADTCEDCTSGSANPASDGLDTDADGICNAGDPDDDGDGVADGSDSQPLNPFLCHDLDADTCDDCTSGSASTASDGLDTDADGICNAGDPDDDNDGVGDSGDGAPLDPSICRDLDADTCDDCTSGSANPTSDGPDLDVDGLCNAGDPDDDGDGVADTADTAPLDPFLCRDLDADTCDDCTGGSANPTNDGPDLDADTLCDAGDNCDAVANPAQTDTNSDGEGDACDPDDDGDGVADASDDDPLDHFTCQDSDADQCDDCATGTFNPANDGPDIEPDGLCNPGDPDDDNDGVLDGADSAPYDRFLCQDVDVDTCDDCTSGSANVANDGTDTDADTLCDAGDNCDGVANPTQTDTNVDGEGDACDPDDDGDGVADGSDSQPLNRFVCQDADADTCEDCTSGSANAASDGPDLDADGLCDAGDPEADGDGVLNTADSAPLDRFHCQDVDADACDDCTSGTVNPASDGTDTDADGLCDAGDPDDDGDGVADAGDGQPLNEFVCRDLDADTCDDCTSGSADTANDGADLDADGLCNAGDLDDDGDGVGDATDSQPLNHLVCQDADADSCDDCTSGTVNPASDGADLDADGLCDAGDNCDAIANPTQTDTNVDGEGDVCDLDDDGDGIDDLADSQPLNRFACLDSDIDNCDDCISGSFNPDGDGTDTDLDGVCDPGDPDDDGDGVNDVDDSAPHNRFVCRDWDADTCDDCTYGSANPPGDGPDLDGDLLCDAGDNCDAVANPTQTDTNVDGEGDACDPDDDGDGVNDGTDSQPLNKFVCQDADADSCEDCTSGVVNPASDGPDFDADGACNAGDADDDNDGVADATDPNDGNADLCGDSDTDTCDDCGVGTDNTGPLSDSLPGNDGPDFDVDGKCNAGDPDDDNDGVADATDPNDGNADLCGDSDTDTCDDCAVGTDNTGPLSDSLPGNDGPDFDVDGKCNAGDPDDDNDGVADAPDPNDANADVCGDSDTDTCDDCVVGTDNTGPLSDSLPGNDGTDFDVDGKCDAGDPDDDNDGVADAPDPNDFNADVCGDSDTDTCDDCVVGTDNTGPLSDSLPGNDGTDFDVDGKCDAGDTDDDNDGVADATDPHDGNADLCGDTDADTCDDCAVGTDNGGPLSDSLPGNDGPDFDADGACNAGDTDDDNDGVADVTDPNDGNADVCGDTDTDTCDDCAVGTDNTGPLSDSLPGNDGADFDADGACNAGDADDDNDGVADATDPNDGNPHVCGDTDTDTCDDCAVGTDNTGPLSDSLPGNDGADFDVDGKCNAGDPDDDNDGVVDATDPNDANADVCGDSDADTCDDCVVGTDNTGPLSDSLPGNDGADFDVDGSCNAGDTDDDNDGVADATDPNDGNPDVCGDSDIDICDDCTVGTDNTGPLSDSLPGNDGADFDVDGSCNAGDTDDDNDGVADVSDSAPLDPHACMDFDDDTCDDCTSGTFNLAADGPDNDLDGSCDTGDPDDDNDSVPDAEDLDPLDPSVCQDLDGDTCDDCSRIPVNIVEAGFDTGANGFVYLDDTFRGTNQPSYASGSYQVSGGFDGGALAVFVGGIDNNTILAMSGGWRYVFELSEPGHVAIQFRYNLSQSPNYEPAEYSEALVSLDQELHGTPPNDFVWRVFGNGNGGGVVTTGWQQFSADLGPRAAGSHTLVVGAFNNQKNQVNESTTILIDDFVVVAGSGSGLADPTNDGADGDADGACDAGDFDDDNDGVADATDPNDANADICGDSDTDTCDDCAVGTDNTGPLSDSLPGNDGADFDADGACNAGDADDDNDGVADATDPNDGNADLCGDSDTDTCDDCAVGTDNTGPLSDSLPGNDGPDFDADGSCNASDTDDDNDGVADATDPNDGNADLCGDSDTDTCDDCTVGTDNTGPLSDSLPGNDGPDFDVDGKCNAGDPDDDNDGVADTPDPNDANADLCGDSDTDTCDDCAVGTDNTGPLSDSLPGNDGPDFDVDGACNAGDTDDDNDGVADATDPNDGNADLCGDSDTDTCDDCTVGTDNTGPLSDSLPGNDGVDFDADGACNAGDPDDDNDGVADATDPNDGNADLCGDSDTDTCDDCAVGTDNTGPLSDSLPGNDGVDFDADGACNAGDPDDDNDGVADAPDPNDGNADLCGDSDTDTCDDCAVGTDNTGPLSDSLPGNDGVDFDADGACNAGDPDDDNDGVADAPDPNDGNADVCGDSDTDTCDDCVVGTDNTGPLSDSLPGNDGPDLDADGACNAGDPDDDGDGIADAADSAPLDRFLCEDLDTDGCDDCTSGTANTASDGTDTDADGLCDTGDPDDDGDGVADAQDVAPLNPNACRDLDADGCDDCTSGTANTASDGTDTDADGLCDTGDPDDDGDGVADAQDVAPLNPNACHDLDADGCDDCTSGIANMASDGTDTDADGLCNTGDPDDDGDGVPDAQDVAPLNPNACRDLDADDCDDCTSGIANPASDGTDTDADGACDAGDNCPAVVNSDQTDTDVDGAGDVCDPDDDGDGVSDAQDCASLVPAVSSAPGAIGDSLRLRKDNGVLLSWDRGWQGHASNVYRATFEPGAAWSYAMTCLEAQNPGTTLGSPDTEAPPVHGLFIYLVSAVNVCGESPLGPSSFGETPAPSVRCPLLNEDTDGDGHTDLADNCPLVPNDQADADQDYVGDACD